MADRKVITVVGATGSQGRGLVRAILADRGEFAARALTRDPNSSRARELAALGAEVVRGDVDDPASLERAFQGAWGAYCVTFYWNHFSPEKEMAEARAMAEAAKKARLEHVIWSTLEDTRQWVPLSDTRMPTLQGQYKVPHFDAKGASDRFFKESGLPTTFLLTTFYWENFVFFGMGPKKDDDGRLALKLPMGDEKLAGIAADDIGKCALGVFKAGREYHDKTVGIAGELLSGKEMAAAFSRELDKDVVYRPLSPAAYRKLGFPGADDLGNMFQFYTEFAAYFARSRDVALARKLNPTLWQFEPWLAANAGRVPMD